MWNNVGGVHPLNSFRVQIFVSFFLWNYLASLRFDEISNLIKHFVYVCVCVCVCIFYCDQFIIIFIVIIILLRFEFCKNLNT